MFDFKIVPDDGEPFELTATMRDVVMWEKTHKGRAFAQLSDSMSASMLFEIAYSACRRQQRVPREMTEAQFTATHDIELGADEQQAEPEAGPVPPEPDEPDPFDAFAVGRASVPDEPADPTQPGAWRAE